MNKFFKIIFFAFCIVLASCSSNKDKKTSIIEGEDLEFQMIAAYEEGYKELQKDFTYLPHIFEPEFFPCIFDPMFFI